MRQLLRRLGATPWVRRVVIGGVALAVFLLGATYLSLRHPPDIPSFTVIGTGKAAAGQPTAVRVRARLHDERRSPPVKVSDVQLARGSAAAVSVPFSATEGDPALVTLDVPPANGGDNAPTSATLRIFATAEGRTLAIDAPLEILNVDPSFDSGLRPPVSLPKTDKPFRMTLAGEGAGVVSQLDNRMFVRVRNAAGLGVSDAKVTIRHKSLEGGAIVLHTDANGLATWRLVADRPSYVFKSTVDKDGETAEFEDTVVPAGRQLLLRSDRGTLAPGEVGRVQVIAWHEQDVLFCDVRRGAVWVSSRRVQLNTDGSAFEIGPFARPGRYDIQCAAHPSSPGNTWATLPLIVGPGEPLELLTDAVRAAHILAPVSLELVATERQDDAAGYLTSLLNAPMVAPEILAGTHDTDLEAREAEWGRKKRVVLFALGGVFLLVLLLVLDLIIGNVIATRDRMRAYAAELADEGDEIPTNDELDELTQLAHKSREGLVKTRGLLLLVLVGGTLIANIIGFLTLMALIR